MQEGFEGETIAVVLEGAEDEVILVAEQGAKKNFALKGADRGSFVVPEWMHLR